MRNTTAKVLGIAIICILVGIVLGIVVGFPALFAVTKGMTFGHAWECIFVPIS